MGVWRITGMMALQESSPRASDGPHAHGAGPTLVRDALATGDRRVLLVQAHPDSRQLRPPARGMRSLRPRASSGHRRPRHAPRSWGSRRAHEATPTIQSPPACASLGAKIHERRLQWCDRRHMPHDFFTMADGLFLNWLQV